MSSQLILPGNYYALEYPLVGDVAGTARKEKKTGAPRCTNPELSNRLLVSPVYS
jgi:hypothetical protein